MRNKSLCLSLLICLAVCLVLFVAVSVIFLVLSSTLLNSLNSSDLLQLTDFSVPSGYPVLLGANGIDPASSSGVEISTNAAKTAPLTDLNVKLYQGHCQDTQYREVNLPNVSRDIQPLADSRLAFNYNYGDLPLYVAGGNSTVTYTISASNGPSSSGLTDDTDCSVELFLFDDQLKYSKFVESNYLREEGYVNRSGCLPVGTKDEIKNSTTVFYLSKPNSYFVSISLKENIETLTNISAHALEFSDVKLESVDCALNEFTNKCKITFDDKSTGWFQLHSSEPLQCIWAESEAFVTINVTAVANGKSKSVYTTTQRSSIAGLGVCMVIVILLISSGVIYWLMSKNYQDEKKPLLWKNVNVQSY